MPTGEMPTDEEIGDVVEAFPVSRVERCEDVRKRIRAESVDQVQDAGRLPCRVLSIPECLEHADDVPAMLSGIQEGRGVFGVELDGARQCDVVLRAAGAADDDTA